MNAYELGWLAGIIDGEGSIMLSKLRRKGRPNGGRGFAWQARLKVSNTNMELLLRVKSLAGCGWISKQGHVNPNGGKRQVYDFVMSTKGVLSLLPRLKLVAKERQRVLVLEAATLLQEHVGRGRGPDGRSLGKSSQHDPRLESICREMHSLNARGSVRDSVVFPAIAKHIKSTEIASRAVEEIGPAWGEWERVTRHHKDFGRKPRAAG